ncbi:MAG TPA: hypothetical protein PKC13_31790 [Blastocatellia bacterium]|nr:hypothetical protein [Blastocatellia bacterium]
MKNQIITKVLLLTLAMSGWAAMGNIAQTSDAQGRSMAAQRSAVEWGYVAGYSDGYTTGTNDYDTRATRDYRNSVLYEEARRGYESRLGSFGNYQEGYRLGFEFAYNDGYFNRPYNASIPKRALAARGLDAAKQHGRMRPSPGVTIPDGTEMRLRLTTTLNTKINHEGDRFTAEVVEPSAWQGATVEGHIAHLERSGRMTGHTEMALEFDRIVLRSGRTSSFHAQIEKIYASDKIKSVDEEGNIETASKNKDVTIRTTGGAILGAIIGGIAKGGKGAAIGAIIGAGVGAGSVYVQGNKDLILERGTEMSVRTSASLRERALMEGL